MREADLAGITPACEPSSRDESEGAS